MLMVQFRTPVFVSWALRSVRESLIQVDPLAAAIANKASKGKPLPTISRTPFLLQFTPFGSPPLPSCGKERVTSRREVSIDHSHTETGTCVR
uniref:Secreted protein n=1 Tax=Heterorhabditis bacteriophora TaxID=37862 RepID=A0A1I7XEB0_HETBA